MLFISPAVCCLWRSLLLRSRCGTRSCICCLVCGLAAGFWAFFWTLLCILVRLGMVLICPNSVVLCLLLSIKLSIWKKVTPYQQELVLVQFWYQSNQTARTATHLNPISSSSILDIYIPQFPLFSYPADQWDSWSSDKFYND